MAEIRVYLAVQRLNLSDSNWNTLITVMKAKGDKNQDPNPGYRNHWRPSLDGSILIFEAVFESSVVDVDWFISWSAGIFGIDPALVTETTGYNAYGRFSTFAYQSINRFRIGIFGFIQGQGWPLWEDSRAAAQQYIKDNTGSWE